MQDRSGFLKMVGAYGRFHSADTHGARGAWRVDELVREVNKI
jgi:hypothetical protein